MVLGESWRDGYRWEIQKDREMGPIQRLVRRGMREDERAVTWLGNSMVSMVSKSAVSSE